MAASHARGGVPGWFIGLLAGVLALLLGGGLCAAFIVREAWVAYRTPQPTVATPTRDQFRAQVMGLDRDAVVAKIGRPKRTYERSANSQAWVYYWMNMDPISGKLDSSVTLTFQSGVVKDVEFSP